MNPVDYGWSLTDDDVYKLVWYEGEASPRTFDVVAEDKLDEHEEIEGGIFFEND